MPSSKVRMRRQLTPERWSMPRTVTDTSNNDHHQIHLHFLIHAILFFHLLIDVYIIVMSEEQHV